MDYNARYYDPGLGRFVSPDSIIPSIGDPQALDRYAYTYNNPLKYNDPSGHCIWDACLVEATALAIAGIAAMVLYYEQTQTPEFQQAVQDITEQVGTAFTPPSVPASNPDAFPLGSPPDPYSPPGVELDVPEWSGLPGVPLDQPDTGSRAIDLPLLDQPGIGDNLLLYGGGRYKDLPGGPGIEKHHMPAASASPLPYTEGPAIEMDALDHYDTASWGRGGDAYRSKQKALIDQGRFGDAIQMDIDDIQSKFGSKYDDAILEMIDSLPDGW